MSRKVIIALSLVIAALGVFSFSAYAETPRPKIGLVLGGGGARGAAHVGVIKILEENNVPIDYIAGTSMGAIVGGLYAAGMSPDEIEQVFASVDWKNLFTDRPSDKDLSFRNKRSQRKLVAFEFGLRKGKLILPEGLITGQKMDFLLKSKTLAVADIDNFDDLPIPYRAVAADIESGEAFVMDHGNLAEAIRASMSIPGVFAPVEIDGHLLVDGGIVDNLPIEVARKMGADIIIAVNVASPLLDRAELKSAIDITSQMMNILTIQNVNIQIAGLTKRDLLITPDLGTIGGADFGRSAEIIRMGTKTAVAMQKELQAYSASAEQYSQFLERQRRDKFKPFKVDFVEVEHPKRVHPEVIEARIKTRPGSTLDLQKLEDDLTRVYAIGDFQEVDFTVAEDEDRKGIVIKTKAKSWGPNYMRFGLNIMDDFEGGAFYNLLTETRATELNSLGAEWKTEAQIGRTLSFATEFYQPLDYSERFFILPKLEYKRAVADIYSGETRLAEYRVRSLTGGLDTGINFGTFAVAKVGVVRGKTKAGPLVGGDYLPNFDIDSAGWTGSLEFDQFDNANFPRYGIIAGTSVFVSDEGLGAEEKYNKVSFGVMKATTLFNHHTFLVGGDAATNFDDKEVPFYDENSLGGFLNLSGYRPGEIRGQHSALGRVIYSYKLTKLSSNDVYVGGSLEAGNAWSDRDNMAIDDLIFAGSAFIGLDTIFGPLYLGYGIAEKRTDGSAYLYLGQTF